MKRSDEKGVVLGVYVGFLFQLVGDERDKYSQNTYSNAVQ